MAKTIVTHHSPDFDGIPAIWLLKKFHPDFTDAKVAFAPAGGTYNGEPVDSNEDIVHVDTGMGRFDHHQTNDFICGAQLVYEWLVKEGYIKDDEAIARMVKIFTEVDHAWDVYKWPEPASDRWEFNLHNIMVGWKMNYPKQDEKIVEWTVHALDAVYKVMQNKVAAEKEVEGGKKFKTRWGEGVAIYTANDAVLDAAMKGGYAVVARKDPGRGYIRVTGSNEHNVDLTRAYEICKEKDPDATWFLHASKVLLRNGSTRNPTMKPTKLELEALIEILEKA
ncbi:hypothetical protein A2870_04315 [Candidatus Curtissbacteria bacterium RIFCSPHIGHO2_01_FULL_41_11]|uniref:Uncharacterized protein n=1 Tax=Candidatus Curtissbacteria bacterium RIFCSPHIGHO2_01_FULL_41_11 TaxID=1797711 RepID=A0A1F5G543_9BACT|nr:MAG: hypothetical protein A2870_04315 [Candidatus Curtissbacteria bacterium RIFCSPHIGHO2_01_FULL_41_11]